MVTLDDALELVGSCWLGEDGLSAFNTLKYRYPLEYYFTFCPDKLQADFKSIEKLYTRNKIRAISVYNFHMWVAGLITQVDADFTFTEYSNKKRQCESIAKAAEEWWLTRADMMCGIYDQEN